MKTTIFNKKALAFFGAAAILLAAVFTIGCKTDTGSGDPAPETFAVAFSVDGANGTLKAKADGIAETDKSPIVVQKGKTVTFTATPDSGYRVKGWTLDGAAVNGTNNSYTFSVTKAVNVQVSFESNSTPLSKYTVTFSVDGGNGKLKAKADGVAETTASPITVEKGKTVTFTATPKNGYKVDKWTITGGTFESGTGTEGSTTAKVTITANTKVNVSFKTETITPPSPTEFTVEMTHGEHGTVTASPVIPTSGKVAKDTVITFTAAPESGYKVDKWTITGGAFEAGTGTEGSTTAKAKITANTKVSVSFISSIYAIVPFGTNGAGLDNHLKNTAPHTDGIYYIKVTGLTAADLKGEHIDTRKPSALGKILNDNPTKKVALKLSEVSGYIDMSACFYKCESLTQAPAIPSGVTYMQDCFLFCTSLTQAPVIPSSVTYMSGCFYGCKSLIQAPEISSGVTYMNHCFYGCKSLIQAPVIPNGVTYMQNCFSNCESLIQVPEIPSGVTNMESCFYGCKSLTQAPVIPNTVTDMKQCFYACESLTQAPVISSNVTYMSECFSDCTSLTQAPVIPSGVTNMESCFYGCTSLTQAPVIPSSVTDMNWCFYGCKKLTAVTLKCNYNAAEVYGYPAFKNAFKNCEKLSAGSIKVPAGQVQTYKENAAKMGARKEWFVAE